MSMEGKHGTTAAPAKANSRIPVRNLWHMLLYAWGEARFQSYWKAEIETAPNLHALLTTLLLKLIQQRLRVGLGRDYREINDCVPGIRGRINFAESVKRLAFVRGEAICKFQSFDRNVLKNQIVRSVLNQLIYIGRFGNDENHVTKLRQELRRTVRDLDCVDFIDVTPELIRRQFLKRLDADYRLMLRICSLIIQAQMPTEAEGELGLSRLNYDEMVLWRIFERFVAQFYAMHLGEWSVTIQPTWRWNESTPRSPLLPRLRPDIAMRHRPSGKLVVLDTKFTPNLLVEGQWEKRTVNRNHLFQMYAYLRSQEHRSEAHRHATGVLLYPAVDQFDLAEAYLDGHRICWSTVDLSQPWGNVEAELLARVQA